MLEGLLQAFITGGVIPEVLQIIKNHFDLTGNLPTLVQVIAQLHTDAQGGILIGQAWLDAHK